MKRALALLIATVMASGVFVGCGSSTANGDVINEISEDANNGLSKQNEEKNIIAEARNKVFVKFEADKDVSGACDLLLPLANEGNAEAQYLLGSIYLLEFKTLGMEQNEAYYNAHDLFKKSMESDFILAYLGLSQPQMLIIDGVSGEEYSHYAEKAFEKGVTNMSVDELGADGAWWIATTYASGRGAEVDKEKSLEWAEKAGDAGNIVAMNTLAIYSNHISEDFVSAAKWYEKAALAGDTYSKGFIGEIYMMGVGVERDTEKGIGWFESAANDEYAHAMLRLGDYYMKGIDGIPDFEKAAEWYEKAAEHNSKDAMSMIGVMYLQGIGVPQDINKSIDWLSRAEQTNDEGEMMPAFGTIIWD